MTTGDLRDAEVGVRYDYNVYTHCGLQSFRINSRTWVPVDGFVPQRDDYTTNVDQGFVVLIDEAHGTYTTSRGVEVPIQPTSGGDPMRGCI